MWVLIKMIFNFFLGIIYCWYAFDWHSMFILDFWILDLDLGSFI